MKLKFIFTLLFISLFYKAAKAQSNNFEISSGIFAPSKHLFQNKQEENYNRTNSYNFKSVYFYDIDESPFSIGISLQYLKYNRNFNGFILDQNNPDREVLPTNLNMEMSQNMTLISLFFAYNLKLSNKWETQIRLGTGTSGQSTPILNYQYAFPQNSSNQAYLLIRSKYIENNPKEVGFDELSIKVNYYINEEHSFGFLLCRTGQVYQLRRLISSNNDPALEGKKLFNVQTELQVNDKNYFYNHNTLFAGTSFNFSYTYKF